MRSILVCGLVLAGMAICSGPSLADSVVLPPSADNTIYETAVEVGEFSNGAGEYMFAGRTNDGPLRRALLRFNIAGSIPAGSTVTSVQLRIHCSRAAGGTRPCSVHKLTADWGEGASDAFAPGGGGAPSEAGDASWRFSFYPATPWTNDGGDFAPAPSAAATTGGAPSFVTFATNSNLVADVQSWLDVPSENFGWILRGDETPGVRAGKRYDTVQNVTVAFRPQLTVNYDPPPPFEVGDMNCDGAVSVGDIAGFVLALTDPQAYAVAFPGCDINNADVNNDTAVSVGDIGPFVILLSGG